MSRLATQDPIGSDAAMRLGRAVAVDGSVGHPFRVGFDRIAGGPDGHRAVADTAHHLCALHGPFPGLLEDVARTDDRWLPDGWLAAAIEAFAVERALLVRLTAAAGPIPGTPGQRESESASRQQRHAIEMLGRSDRRGCASGAATALILDWPAVRAIVETIAIRLGIAAPPSTLPSTNAVLAAIASAPAPIERALGFGADQLLSQQRGLWTLLDARHRARMLVDAGG